MDEPRPLFMKTDDNKIINVNLIRWVQKKNECLHICMKANGCSNIHDDMHKICKQNCPDSYRLLNEYFKSLD